jgi:hypothetical protein
MVVNELYIELEKDPIFQNHTLENLNNTSVVGGLNIKFLMTYRYKNGLHEEHHSNSDTKFTYRLFFTHLFLILHSQTLQSLITCRPVPVLFLQVHGWLKNVLLPLTFSPDVGKSKYSSATSYI